VVLWKQVQRVALVVICEVDENQYLAANFLTLFANLLMDQYKSANILTKPKELLNKPEEMLMLLQTYLPNGQLLFISDQYAKHLRREFDESLLVA